ncbi:MAG: hypothetical protein LDL26_04655 [Caenispirillum bisanense]|nr:hypothetical protein [Caenispirillum bisanense]MCA1973195.1 hypothetical protein [Caenispirillum sp.]
MRRSAGRTVAAAGAVDHIQGNVSKDGAMGVTLKLDDLPEDVVRRLRVRALSHGRSLEEEAAAILSEAAQIAGGDVWEAAARMREEMKQYDLLPSQQIIREMRDSR